MHLNYFTKIQKWESNEPTKITEFVTFRRKYEKSRYDINKWINSKKSMLPFELVLEGTIESNSGENCLEVDFANRFVGGGVLRSGSVQEEIMFMTSPECIPSLLFFEALGEDEVVYIENAAKINLCVGYKQNFRFAGDFLENTKKKSPNVIVAMDAIPFNNISDQIIKSNILI